MFLSEVLGAKKGHRAGISPSGPIFLGLGTGSRPCTSFGLVNMISILTRENHCSKCTNRIAQKLGLSVSAPLCCGVPNLH
jgi:hypothetical protein